MSENKYPISEIFTAPQGEGLWAGTLMTFIRFAGCNVGKHIDGDSNMSVATSITKTKDMIIAEGVTKETDKYRTIPIWQEECTLYDGRKFLCDTDFRVKERLTGEEILARVPDDIEHIIFTGGEPLLHINAINYIIDLWEERIGESIRNNVHIETSGTINYWRKRVWMTVSPKANFLPHMIQRANELKFLVDENFNEEVASEIAALYTNGDTIIWLSPINDIKTLSKSNTDKCLDIQSRHKNWRLTNQNHKIWGTL